MSLPPATKDISDHPAKGSVTDPVDKNLLNANVDRKLRFYGVIQALREGKLPDNRQIDQTLRYFVDRFLVDLSKLSPSGKRLFNDVKDLMETARDIVKQKNADELFQNFVWHTRGVDYSPAKRDQSTGAGVSVDKAKQDSQAAAHHLRTLLSLVLTNAEARKLLSDFSLLGRDLLARSVGAIRPEEEVMRHVHETAPENEPKFADREREKARIDETAGGIREGAGVAQEQAKGVAQDALAAAQGSSGSGNGTSTTIGTRITSPDAALTTAPTANDPSSSGTRGIDRQTDVDVAAAKEKTKQRFRDRITGLKERVPQHHRERVGSLYDRAKMFMEEEYFPKERREKFVYRGKKVIIECQKQKDYQESIKWLLETLTEYADHGTKVAGNGYHDVRGVWDRGAMKEATTELRTLLGRFASNTSLDPVLHSVQVLYDVAHRDEELRGWFTRLRDWMRKLLLEPGYVLEPQCNTEGAAIREDGRKFYDDKYKGQFDELFDAVKTWFSNLSSDPLNKRLGHDLSRLTRDLIFDSEGTLTWKPELWADIRKVIVPQLVDQVGYIPIPRAEFTDNNLDLVIENLILSGRNLFPNIISVEAHNFAKFSPYSSIHDESHHAFTFTMSQMQADMRDVMFYFKKKTGVPRMEDCGLADVILGGKGITATVRIIGAGKDVSSVFRVKDVRVKVDTLRFSIRDSRHDALYKLVRPLAIAIVKRQVQRAFRDAIRTSLEFMDQQLVKVRDRMEEAKASEETTRTQALKDLFKRQSDEAAAKERERQEKRQSHFQVVAKRDSLLLPERGDPRGWVNRQQDRDEAAQQGRSWRSKAFSIV